MGIEFKDNTDQQPTAQLGESETATAEPLTSINGKLDAILAALGVSYEEESDEEAAD